MKKILLFALIVGSFAAGYWVFLEKSSKDIEYSDQDRQKLDSLIDHLDEND